MNYSIVEFTRQLEVFVYLLKHIAFFQSSDRKSMPIFFEKELYDFWC